MGLKITVYMHGWGKFWTKRYKDQKTQLPLLKCLEQKQGVGSKSRVLSAPCTRHYKRVGRLPKPPSSQTPRHTPTLTPWKEQACPLTTAEAPVKPCLDFLSGL